MECVCSLIAFMECICVHMLNHITVVNNFSNMFEDMWEVPIHDCHWTSFGPNKVITQDPGLL